MSPFLPFGVGTGRGLALDAHITFSTILNAEIMNQQEFNNRPAQRAHRKSVNNTIVWLRLTFGIFMVLFYVAMGVLLFTPVFDVLFAGMSAGLAWIRYLVAIVLIIYGFWRGYRLYKGVSYEYVDED